MDIANLLTMESGLILLIGLVTGVLGGMLGVGGSVIMIPALTLLLGYNQHLYQAAAMLANVAVSIPAALRHRKAGAMVNDAIKWMLPAALVFVMVGVTVSNLAIFQGEDGAKWLGRVLAGFLLYVIWVNVRRLACKTVEPPADHAHLSAQRCGLVGTAMGSVAGLMGIGGGAIAVPLQQVVLRLPLRSCIANSSAIICITASIGCVYKIGTLGMHGLLPGQAIQTGLMLAPTAWLGGRIGASLTHRLPIRQVRMAFIILMIVATWKMAAL